MLFFDYDDGPAYAGHIRWGNEEYMVAGWKYGPHNRTRRNKMIYYSDIWDEALIVVCPD